MSTDNFFDFVLSFTSITATHIKNKRESDVKITDYQIIFQASDIDTDIDVNAVFFEAANGFILKSNPSFYEIVLTFNKPIKVITSNRNQVDEYRESWSDLKRTVGVPIDNKEIGISTANAMKDLFLQIRGIQVKF